MLLISEEFVDNAVRFKAPSGMMYHITGISYSNRSSTSQFVMVFDQLLEDEVVDATSRLSPISAFACGDAGANLMVNNLDHKTKFITIAKTTSTGTGVFVCIYGDLVKATQLQLLMEWFRKGR